MATKTSKPSARKKATTPTRVRPSKRARRAEIANVTPDHILGHAMLANVCIGMWEGRKHDREVTARVNDEFHANSDAGRYHKHLFGGKVQELSAIITAAAHLRGIHYTQTLPWSDTGWRLLPTTNYIAYTEAMRKAKARYEEAVEAFVAVYPRLVREAKAKLNGMYRESDYPTPDRIRHRYHVALEFSPLPAGSDFRVTLPKAELGRMAKDIEGRMMRSVESAMTDAWERLGDAITKLRPKLDDGKYLRESMIERLRAVAETLGRLNLTGDQALEEARSRVLRELTVFDAETLVDDEKARAQAASAADDILKSMRGVYAPAEAA